MIAPIHFDLTPLVLLQSTKDRHLVTSAVFLPPFDGRQSAMAIVILNDQGMEVIKPSLIHATNFLPDQDWKSTILIDVNERIFCVFERMQALSLCHVSALVPTKELGKTAMTFFIGDTAIQWLVPALNKLNCPVSIP